MGLSAEKRARHILEALDLNGRIHVPTIAAELNVTEVTIRKCVLNYASTPQGQIPFYDIEATPTSMTLDTKDGVATSFYGY